MHISCTDALDGCEHHLKILGFYCQVSCWWSDLVFKDFPSSLFQHLLAWKYLYSLVTIAIISTQPGLSITTINKDIKCFLMFLTAAAEAVDIVRAWRESQLQTAMVQVKQQPGTTPKALERWHYFELLTRNKPN